MSNNSSESEHESWDQNRSNAGEEDDEDAEPDQAPEGLGIRECTAKEDERLIRGAEEVEEEPSGEEAKEDKQWDRVCEQRHGKDPGDDGHIVDSEVGVVLADSERGFGKRLWFRESRAVKELGPWPALGEAVA